jgi:hypothetical protein
VHACEDDVCSLVPTRTTAETESLCRQGSNAEIDLLFNSQSIMESQGEVVRKCQSCEGLGYPTFMKNDLGFQTVSIHSSEGLIIEGQCLAEGDYCIPSQDVCCHGQCPGGWSSYCPKVVESDKKCLAGGEYCIPSQDTCCHGDCPGGWSSYCPKDTEEEKKCLSEGDYCIPSQDVCCHGQCPGGWSSYCPKTP